jgi:hypothetical protein
VSKSLRRVLRVRELLEERRRIELESAAAELRKLEEESEGEEIRARRGREASFSSIGGAEGGGWQTADDRRLAAEGSWVSAVGRRAELEAGRPECEARVQAAREEFLAGRRERMEVETLLDRTAALRSADLDRREQHRLDDWFQASRRGAAATRDGD